MRSGERLGRAAEAVIRCSGTVYTGKELVTKGSLRILVVGINYAPEHTGIARYTTSFAEAASRRGHIVRVLTTHPHYPDWRFGEQVVGWSSQEIIRGVTVARMRHYLPRVPVGVSRVLSEMSFGFRAAFASWGRPDVIVLPSPALFSTAMVLLRALLTNRRSMRVVWVQDLYSLGMRETNQSAKLTTSVARLESLVMRGADSVVAIHPRFQDQIVNALGVPRERTIVVRNWSHMTRPEHVDRAAIRARYGWGPDETLAMHTGNMGLKQGLDNLVAAARLADQESAPIRFVLVGGGSQKQRLLELGAGIDRLEFIESIPDGEFEQVIGSADVLVLNESPGVAELAVPSKLTTYFATGLPVVAATDAGSISASEIETSGGGVRVDAGHPEALLAAILSLRSDPVRATALGAAGLAFRDSCLTEDAAIGTYLEWLHMLVADRRKKITS